MSPSALKPFGIKRVCTVWNISRATIRRHKLLALHGATPKKKRGPKICLADAQVLEEIKIVLRNLRFVGIRSSPSFVRSPEGNGCVERFIRTLKEQLLRLTRFASVEELHAALQEFIDRFNNLWIIGVEPRKRISDQP